MAIKHERRLLVTRLGNAGQQDVHLQTSLGVCLRLLNLKHSHLPGGKEAVLAGQAQNMLCFCSSLPSINTHTIFLWL